MYGFIWCPYFLDVKLHRKRLFLPKLAVWWWFVTFMSTMIHAIWQQGYWSLEPLWDHRIKGGVLYCSQNAMWPQKRGQKAIPISHLWGISSLLYVLVNNVGDPKLVDRLWVESTNQVGLVIKTFTNPRHFFTDPHHYRKYRLYVTKKTIN